MHKKIASFTLFIFFVFGIFTVSESASVKFEPGDIFTISLSKEDCFIVVRVSQERGMVIYKKDGHFPNIDLFEEQYDFGLRAIPHFRLYKPGEENYNYLRKKFPD